MGAAGAVDPTGQAGGRPRKEEFQTALREALGREASPTAAILDSQTLKAAEKGAPRAGAKRTQSFMTPARR